MPFVVRKARHVTEPTYLHRVADRYVPAVRAVFLTAVERAWAATDPDQLAREADFAGNGIAWNVFDTELERSDDVMRGLVRDAARAEIRVLRRKGLNVIGKQHTNPPFEIRVLLDLLNPQAILAASRAANLFRQNLSMETQQAIRAVLVRAQQRGLSVVNQDREILELIETVFGLTERQAIAIDNLRAALTEQGVDAARVAERVRQQAERYLRDRALVISRHETMMAASQGQQAIWQEMVNNGVLAPDTEEEWLTAGDERVCPICLPLDGQRVPIGQPFMSSEVGPIDSGSQAHVQCRCVRRLVIPE